MNSDWEKLALEQVVSIRTGKLDSNAAEENGRFPFFTCSPQTLSINQHAFDTEAVILAGNNANGTFCCKYYAGKFNAYQRTYVIEPLDSSIANCKYLYFYVSHSVNHLKELSLGSATRFLTKTILSSLPIQLPPKHEQDRIAELLSSLDERVALLRATSTTLEAIAQSIFKSWFVDFDPVFAKQDGRIPAGMDEATAALFPDTFEESELGLTPRGWQVGALEDLLVLQRGFDLPASARVPGDYPIIAASGPSGTHYIPMAKAPGVVTGRSGVLGRVFLELEDYWPHNTTLWVKDFRAASPCYAYETLRRMDFASFNAGSAVPTLNRNHIHSLRYVIPPKACVDAFETLAMTLHRRARENQNQALTLITLRDTLLPRLISGQLRISEAEALVD